MHDMFAPFANVMAALQSISIPQWKANLYAKKVAKWLIDASNECHTHGNMEFFPTLKENMEVHNSYAASCYAYFKLSLKKV